MNSQEHFVTIVVDGEELYCPDDVGWDTIRKEHAFRGWPLGAEELLWALIETCSVHPELRVAFGKAGKAFDVWLPYVIACVDSRPTRIQLQRVECPNCGWRGTGGTTAEPDLFLGFGRDFQAKYVEAQRVPACPCPRCRQPMPDHVVWCDGKTLK